MLFLRSTGRFIVAKMAEKNLDKVSFPSSLISLLV